MFRLFHSAWSWNVWKWICFFMMPEKNNNNSNKQKKKFNGFVVKSLALFTYLLCLRAMCLLFVYFNLLRLCAKRFTLLFLLFFCYLLATWWLQDNLSLFIGWSYFVLAAHKTVHIDFVVSVNKHNQTWISCYKIENVKWTKSFVLASPIPSQMRFNRKCSKELEKPNANPTTFIPHPKQRYQ